MCTNIQEKEMYDCEHKCLIIEFCKYSKIAVEAITLEAKSHFRQRFLRAFALPMEKSHS